MKSSTKPNQLTSSRFLNMCVANWCLHIYVSLMIPLIAAAAFRLGGDMMTTAWAVLAFSIGMIIPGPFGAHLMERRSRKEVFLKAMLLIGLVPTVGYVFASTPLSLIMLHGLQGAVFGIAQTALGTTLVNDILLSKQRNKGDIIYAWAGRLGIPIGLFVGTMMCRYVDFPEIYWWALIPTALSFVLVGQTAVPIKAPVKVPLMTCDRFFLPKSLPLGLTMFGAPFVMGRLVSCHLFPGTFLAMTGGILAAFLLQILIRRRLSQCGAVCVGYLVILITIALHQGSCSPSLHSYLAGGLIGFGVGIVSSRHLMEWVDTAEHCQRGTAQSTYMICWRVAFALGFLFGALWLMENVAIDFLVCSLSLVGYVLIRKIK